MSGLMGLMQPGPTLYEADQLRKQRGSMGLLGAVGEPMSYAPGPVGLLGNAMLGAQYLTGEKPIDEGLSGMAMLTALLQGTKAAPIINNAAKAGRAATSIADWKWKPAKEVRNELSVSEVPDYIKSGYGAFMAEQAAKAEAGNLGARDLIKAYTITRSSVNRASRNINDDIAKGAVRPEGYFAEWLLTPKGKQYLDDAEAGIVNKEAIADAVKRFKPFGMADTLGKDMEAAASMSSMGGSVGDAVTGHVGDWRAFSKQFQGIGPSKSGFMASLLGRGDLPTLDARQLTLHTGQPAADASKYIRRGGGAGGDAAVDRLARRQEQMGLQLDDNLAPFYQHLTHHTIWDRVGKSKTTHEDLVRAMKYAALGVPMLYGTSALVDEQNSGLWGQ